MVFSSSSLHDTQTFLLTKCDELETLTFGPNCLTTVREMTIKDCPKLRDISIHPSSIIGDEAAEQKWSTKPPFYYKNKVTLLSGKGERE